MVVGGCRFCDDGKQKYESYTISKIDQSLLNKATNWLGIVLISAAPLLAHQSWFENRSVKQQLKKAVVHYNEGRFATAETILNKTLKQSGDNYKSVTWYLLMKANYGLSKIEESRERARNV